MSENVRGNLSPRQAKAVGFLLAGCSIIETAGKCGVNEKTVRRWLNSPDFASQLKTGKRQVLERVEMRLVGTAERAVGVLVELLNSPVEPGAGVRRLAAVNLLELTQAWREMGDFEERLQALEQAVLHDKK